MCVIDGLSQVSRVILRTLSTLNVLLIVDSVPGTTHTLFHCFTRLASSTGNMFTPVPASIVDHSFPGNDNITSKMCPDTLILARE